MTGAGQNKRDATSRPEGERPIAVARSALRRFRRAGATAPEVTTPERLLRAGGAARVEAFGRTVELDRDGRVEVGTVEAHRIRVEDSPMSRLRARKLLAPGEQGPARSALLAAAAERYRRLWLGAGLMPLQAYDPTRERVSGGAGGGLLRSERQLAHFEAYGAAAAALSREARRVVEAVVLLEREPLDVGREVSGYRQDKQATAVALYLLRTGLTELAAHFGLIGRDE